MSALCDACCGRGWTYGYVWADPEDDPTEIEQQCEHCDGTGIEPQPKATQ